MKLYRVNWKCLRIYTDAMIVNNERLVSFFSSCGEGDKN